MRKKNAILIDVLPDEVTSSLKKIRLEEFMHLIRTLGGIHRSQILQLPPRINYGTYLGTSTIDGLIQSAEKQKIDLIILNNILKPQQIFRLTEIFEEQGVVVWDRMDLILQIFSDHAGSAEAKLQIDLAKIRHMGPRIFGMGMELSRQGGGIGTSGIGETNIEIMKRHLRRQERKIVEKLKKVEKTKDLQRTRRQRQNFKTVSLVGYTNAGKSSLMKILTKKANVKVHNALFVTLDTKVGKLYLPDAQKNVLVSDTIGFIADLPPRLIAAFTSTLSETIHSDLLLHVIDVSDPERKKKIAVVDYILGNLGIGNKKQILVFNKTDVAGKRFGKIKLAKKYKDRNPVFISAEKKVNLDTLKKQIAKALF